MTMMRRSSSSFVNLNITGLRVLLQTRASPSFSGSQNTSVVAGSASFQSEDTGGPFFRTDAKLGHGGGEAGVSGLLKNVLGAFKAMKRGSAAGYGKQAW